MADKGKKSRISDDMPSTEKIQALTTELLKVLEDEDFVASLSRFAYSGKRGGRRARNSQVTPRPLPQSKRKNQKSSTERVKSDK